MRDEQTVATLPRLMMDVPLTITGIREQAVRNHPRREISRDAAGFVRLIYTDFGASRNSPTRLGPNTHRHLELYYGVPCIGAVLHTAIRLFPEQVGDVTVHAGDKVVFVDGNLVRAMRKAITVRPLLKNCAS